METLQWAVPMVLPKRGWSRERRDFPHSDAPQNPTLCKTPQFSLFMVVPNFPFQNLHLCLSPPTPGGCWLRGVQAGQG